MNLEQIKLLSSSSVETTTKRRKFQWIYHYYISVSRKQFHSNVKTHSNFSAGKNENIKKVYDARLICDLKMKVYCFL